MANDLGVLSVMAEASTLGTILAPAVVARLAAFADEKVGEKLLAQAFASRLRLVGEAVKELNFVLQNEPTLVNGNLIVKVRERLPNGPLPPTLTSLPLSY